MTSKSPMTTEIEFNVRSHEHSLRGVPISTYTRVTLRTQTDARRKITTPVRTYLMDRPLTVLLSS